MVYGATAGIIQSFSPRDQENTDIILKSPLNNLQTMVQTQHSGPV